MCLWHTTERPRRRESERASNKVLMAPKNGVSLWHWHSKVKCHPNWPELLLQSRVDWYRHRRHSCTARDRSNLRKELFFLLFQVCSRLVCSDRFLPRKEIPSFVIWSFFSPSKHPSILASFFRSFVSFFPAEDRARRKSIFAVGDDNKGSKRRRRRRRSSRSNRLPIDPGAIHPSFLPSFTHVSYGRNLLLRLYWNLDLEEKQKKQKNP